jgi:hypothetical protein
VCTKRQLLFTRFSLFIPAVRGFKQTLKGFICLFIDWARINRTPLPLDRMWIQLLLALSTAAALIIYVRKRAHLTDGTGPADSDLCDLQELTPSPPEEFPVASAVLQAWVPWLQSSTFSVVVDYSLSVVHLRRDDPTLGTRLFTVPFKNVSAVEMEHSRLGDTPIPEVSLLLELFVAGRMSVTDVAPLVAEICPEPPVLPERTRRRSVRSRSPKTRSTRSRSRERAALAASPVTSPPPRPPPPAAPRRWRLLLPWSRTHVDPATAAAAAESRAAHRSVLLRATAPAEIATASICRLIAALRVHRAAQPQLPALHLGLPWWASLMCYRVTAWMYWPAMRRALHVTTERLLLLNCIVSLILAMLQLHEALPAVRAYMAPLVGVIRAVLGTLYAHVVSSLVHFNWIVIGVLLPFRRLWAAVSGVFRASWSTIRLFGRLTELRRLFAALFAAVSGALRSLSMLGRLRIVAATILSAWAALFGPTLQSIATAVRQLVQPLQAMIRLVADSLGSLPLLQTFGMECGRCISPRAYFRCVVLVQRRFELSSCASACAPHSWHGSWPNRASTRS